MIERRKITDRNEWLQWRMLDLTCSDIGAVVGVDPYKSPLTVYAEKTGLALPSERNKAMRRGNWLEGGVFEAVKDERPSWRIVRPNLYLRDPDLHLGGTPDGIAEDDENPVGVINIQAKIVNAQSFDRFWQDGPPLHYQLQVVAENYLLDAGTGYLAALVLSTFDADLHLYEIPRHGDAEARVREVTREFWGNIKAGRRPAPDYSRDAAIIAAMHPKGRPDPLDLSGDNRMAELLADRSQTRERLDIDLAALETIDTEIKAKMGDHELATLPGWRLSLKEQQRREYTVKATSFRRLRITSLEGDAA